jgi:hypothetical protein
MSKRQRECVFFFDDVVKNYGNQSRTAIFQLFGFENILTPPADLDLFFSSSNKAKRIAILSSEFGISSPIDTNIIVDIFRHPYNRFGEYLRVIIGSVRSALGFNLINGRQAHIVLQWNSPIMDQAFARIIRNVTNFEKEPDENYVRLYRHFITCQLDNGEFKHNTLFERRLKKVESKDFKNAQILHLVDTTAVDCPLHKAAHLDKAVNFSKYCNFMDCKLNFVCDGKMPSGNKINPLRIYDSPDIDNMLEKYLTKKFWTFRNQS